MGMIMGLLIVFGFCGNLMSITVLLRRKMRCEAFNQLLASLCVIDTIFILCNAMSCAYALRINSRKYGDFFHLCTATQVGNGSSEAKKVQQILTSK